MKKDPFRRGHAKQVLIVCNGLGAGGAERVASSLASWLADKGYKVGLFAMSSLPRFYPLETKVCYIEYGNRSRGFRGKLERVVFARKAVEAFKPDVIVSFSYYNAIASIIGTLGNSDIKHVVSERNDPAALRGFIPNLVRRLTYKKADWFIFQTDDAQNFFSDRIKKRSSVILNPLAGNLPRPYDGLREKRIVNFCRLEPQKNLPLLIDAFEMFEKSHRGWTLDIYGDGSQRGQLEEYLDAKELQESVNVFHSASDVHEKVLGAGMFVSSSKYEGLSNSMLEAMALGLPTICTDCPCGGPRTVIENGENGLLVPEGNARSLAEAMSSVADDYELSFRLSMEARKIRERLESEQIFSQWAEVISNL
ncbi:glycosyltransferase [Alistipes putredinis]|uniref:glycosyltransferase n=1 Tax=Alistipes putredinis TaxID=28117 RepID=UPI003A859FA5